MKGMSGAALFLGMFMAIIFLVIFIPFNNAVLEPLGETTLQTASGMDATAMKIIPISIFIVGLAGALFFRSGE